MEEVEKSSNSDSKPLATANSPAFESHPTRAERHAMGKNLREKFPRTTGSGVPSLPPCAWEYAIRGDCPSFEPLLQAFVDHLVFIHAITSRGAVNSVPCFTPLGKFASL